MPDEFTGPATPMSEADIFTAARALDCEVAAVKAVIDVESRGGFLADGRPKILFERHLFSRFTGKAHDKPPNDDIANPSPGGYKGGAAEYGRLMRAIALDRTAALKSASWGAFQILGSNFAASGFADVDSFCRAMCQSEGNQLNAFVAFVRANNLADELKRHDWAGFARGYNGPNYKINRYDEKLANAYRVHSEGGPRTDGAGDGRTLRMGDRGDDVKALQKALGIATDGDFGPATRSAVMAYQTAHGLNADGVVGPLTRRQLGI
jgi:hypothetical protein